MTQTDITTLVDFYNLILEAERAGVAVLGELISQTEDQHLQELKKGLRFFFHLKGRACEKGMEHGL